MGNQMGPRQLELLPNISLFDSPGQYCSENHLIVNLNTVSTWYVFSKQIGYRKAREILPHPV